MLRNDAGGIGIVFQSLRISEIMFSCEIDDHTADFLVNVKGDTLEECFAGAAYAMFDGMVDLSDVTPAQSVTIRVRGNDWEEKLYSLLSELLFIEDVESLILKEFSVSFDGDSVVCEAKGETLDRSRHKIRTEIKAVTYHLLSVNPDIPSVTVLFDVRFHIIGISHSHIHAQIGMVLHRTGAGIAQPSESCDGSQTVRTRYQYRVRVLQLVQRGGEQSET